MEGVRSERKWWFGVGVAHLVMGTPTCLSFSYLSCPHPSLPQPSTLLPGITCLPGYSFAVGLAVDELRLRQFPPVLAEFQTPTIFDSIVILIVAQIIVVLKSQK